jgi:hypothetical protein
MDVHSESGNADAKKAETVVVGKDAEEATVNSYRPSRWQSNITIISCVSLRLPDQEPGFKIWKENPANSPSTLPTSAMGSKTPSLILQMSSSSRYLAMSIHPT